MNERDASMDAILASIRAAVADEPTAAVSIGAEPPHGADVDPAPRGGADGSVPPAQPAAIENGGLTVEALVRSALTPVLKAWLDAHLTDIVDRAAQAEIARLIGRGG